MGRPSVLSGGGRFPCITVNFFHISFLFELGMQGAETASGVVQPTCRCGLLP